MLPLESVALVCIGEKELPTEWNDEIEMDGDGSMDDGDVSNANEMEYRD